MLMRHGCCLCSCSVCSAPTRYPSQQHTGTHPGRQQGQALTQKRAKLACKANTACWASKNTGRVTQQKHAVHYSASTA